MQLDLTRGNITATMLRFALPMVLGNLLQQFYNVADTLIVGRFLGTDALAAVGSAYTLMTFLTSILLGLCMGSGVVFSLSCGRRDEEHLRHSIFVSFVLIGAFALVLNGLVFVGMEGILWVMQVPAQVAGLMEQYLFIIFFGILATFLYNYFASLLRAMGNSSVPLMFLAVSAILNIVLDLWFVLGLRWGVQGAAGATVLAQWLSGLGIAAYTCWKMPHLLPARRHMHMERHILREIAQFSVLTCVQQSVMNFGILMVQGRVNSFGPAVMAAFAAGVKIDSFAYMPVQDFGNAFSTFVAQNYGAGKADRIRGGIRSAVITATVFCIIITVGVWVLARPLLLLFIAPEETEILAIGVQYLHVEGAFYCGIGYLFLLYGLYRAVRMPGMSVVLTVISLGTRVLLAYTLSAIPAIGVTGIWWSVPIGWVLADLTGFVYYHVKKQEIEAQLYTIT